MLQTVVADQHITGRALQQCSARRDSMVSGENHTAGLSCQQDGLVTDQSRVAARRDALRPVRSATEITPGQDPDGKARPLQSLAEGDNQRGLTRAADAQVANHQHTGVQTRAWTQTVLIQAAADSDNRTIQPGQGQQGNIGP